MNISKWSGLIKTILRRSSLLQPSRTAGAGFSKLEILIVTLILAILATVAVPQYLRSVESSRQVEAIEILAEIRRAEYRYNAKAGHFTGELADLSFEDAELLDDPFFAFDIPSATKSTFILRALRNDSKRLKETPAYAITMDHKGNLNRGI